MQATALSPRSLRLPPRLLRAATDERLVAALRRGDEKAFEAIYDRHHRALLGFCRHMLGSHEEAEDALQRVFVAAHRHLSDGTAPINLKPWLYTIARNRCLSMLRARRETLALDDVREPSANGLALADEVELGEDLKDLLGDVARLPDDQRAALVLAELGDLSQQEIATILDVRTDKVKALIFQAREALAGWRQARETSCGEICEQLSTLKGSALRRAPIRRHLAVCPACTAFEAEVKRQRLALSLVLPVVPSVALKHSVLAATLSAGPGAAAAGAGGVVAAGTAGAGASGVGVKALVVAALAVSAGGGGVVAVREIEQPRPVDRPAAKVTTRRAEPAAVPAALAAPVAGPRGLQVPVATPRPPAATQSPSRKHQRAQAPPKPAKTHGRSGQHAAAHAAPGRQLAAARSAPGRQRAAAAKPVRAVKVRPVPAKPAKPVHTPAAKVPASKRKATPPAAAHGKSR
jgi:RNA polymerase sigma factor (sigma-70 family)